MSARYERMFADLAARNAGAVIPFLMLGDPDAERSVERIDALVAAGAAALELGIPFSDPVADGPAIAAAAARALAAGITPARCFGLIAEIRARHPSLPIGLLVYANLVYARGVEDFFARAAGSGADSVLVPDVPLRESAALVSAGLGCGIDNVFIAPPAADAATVRAVAQASRGYTYVLGRAGVTGTDRAPAPPAELIRALVDAGAPPCIVGFGVSDARHVQAALAAGAAGVVVGSALAGDADPGARLRTLVR